MKVLVIGSLPPPATDRSRALLAEVLRQRREGAEVEVLSPTPSAVAHRNLELAGPAAAIEIAVAARKADRVIVQLEPGFPLADDTGRAGRALGLGALATALRAARGEVTVRLHAIDDLARGAGGRSAAGLWQLAAAIEVGDEATRDRLAEDLGPELAGRISLALGPIPLGGSRGAGAGLGADASLTTVTGIVRARAASEREQVLGEPVGPSGSSRARPRVPLWQWSPVPGAGVPEWASPPAPATAGGPPLRRVARACLLAAESRELTRPLARGARAARRLLRG